MSVRARTLITIGMLGSVVLGGLLSRAPVSARGAVAPMSTLEGFSEGSPGMRSAGALAFGPAGVLFVGDSRGGSVFALAVDDPTPDAFSGDVEVPDVDRRLARLLGIDRDEVAIRDMAVNPATRHIYFSVTRGRAANGPPVLVRSTLQGELSIVSLDQARFSRLSLGDAPDESAKTPWGANSRSLAITDLAYSNGELLVAGLSNEQFSSALRRVKFPFGPGARPTSLEIFHTSHGRYETAAPIETFLPYPIKGKPSLLAGYGCAPLAVFDMEDLAAGRHVRGRTLAELGGGNRPSDMVAVEYQGRRSIIIANSDRSLMRMGVDDIERSEPVTTAASPAHPIMGTPYTPLAVVGVMQMDLLDPAHVLLLLRNTEDGFVRLTTYPVKYL